ncbi:MAG: hypothetical protein Q9188_004153 [Gyalolechia gomerana]
MSNERLSIGEADLLAWLSLHDIDFDTIAQTMRYLPIMDTCTVLYDGAIKAKFKANSTPGGPYDPKHLCTTLFPMKGLAHEHGNLYRYWLSFHNYYHERHFERVSLRSDVEYGPEEMVALVKIAQATSSEADGGSEYRETKKCLRDELEKIQHAYMKWKMLLRGPTS